MEIESMKAPEPKATQAGMKRFVDTLRAHLNVTISPNDPERERKQELWLKSIFDCLRYAEDGVLDEAARRLLRQKRSDRRFPLPGEIEEVIGEIVTERNRLPINQVIYEQQVGAKTGAYSYHRTVLTLDLLSGQPLTRQAIDEQWLGALVDFVRTNSRLPDAKEVPGVMASARNFDAMREGVYRDQGVMQLPDGRWTKGWPLDREGKTSELQKICQVVAEGVERRNRVWAEVLMGLRPREDVFKPLPTAKELAAKDAAAA